MGRKRKNLEVVVGNPENLPSVVVELSDEPVSYEKEPYKAKLWAKYAWMNGSYNAGEIAEAIDTSKWRILRWINGTQATEGWKEELERAEARTVSNVVARNSKRIDYTLGKALDLLAINTERLVNERHHLSIPEYNMFVTAYEKLFKLKQLEEGKPTEIVDDSGKEISWAKIREQIEAVDILDFKRVAKVEG